MGAEICGAATGSVAINTDPAVSWDIGAEVLGTAADFVTEVIAIVEVSREASRHTGGTLLSCQRNILDLVVDGVNRPVGALQPVNREGTKSQEDQAQSKHSGFLLSSVWKVRILKVF